MATTYTSNADFASAKESRKSLIHRLFDRYVEARQREANRRVINYLRVLDYDTLRVYGFTDEQIRKIYNGDVQRSALQ